MEVNSNKRNKGLKFLIFAGAYILICAIILLTNLQSVHLINASIMCAIVLIAILGIVMYLSLSDKRIMDNVNYVLTMCATIVIHYAVIVASSYLFSGDVFAIPFALSALMLAMIFSESKCGFFANFFVVFIYFASLVLFGENVGFDSNCLYVLLSAVTTSLVASMMAKEHFKRVTYIFVGLVLGLVSAVCACIVYFIYAVDIDLNVLLIQGAYAFASGVLNVMLMFLIVPLWEVLFNVVSDFRLAEISSTSAPLLKKMYSIAPGSYNHSLVVANYCEACAVAIDENPFLARACAYYHDIGKMKNSKYYTENQMGIANPHDSLTPEASVTMIKNHVLNGLAMAKEAKLPFEIRKAIAEHHGTLPIKYFYLKAQRYTDGELPIKEFSYDGPRPTSKVSAILMICDACEAALRADDKKENAVKIVEQIINERIEFGQFDNCNITFRDIQTIKQTIISTYQGVEHERIQYSSVKLEIGGEEQE